ncbi:DEAD/DEAH box helicase [Brevibacterium sp. BRM-1]|uniref:DEAD/DEAH box helicase n=1 Tax=Brevibacterium sp. BRM-1 TaxID=2999062 RepID=UPI00227E66FD|nr:DEAD/DEAH box helicase [Brevibacterium sp. BRM-1]WAL39618.1 DEAD/DEAH box helicase [Brevibacterium sp. BRM-1]
MSPDPLPYVTEQAIARLVGGTVAQRGREYAGDGSVGDVEWQTPTGTLVGDVAGTGPHPYVTTVHLQAVGTAAGGSVTRYDPVRAICTCPVKVNCKHAAAVLYRVSLDAMRAQLTSALPGPGTSAPDAGPGQAGPPPLPAEAAQGTLADSHVPRGPERAAVPEWRQLLSPVVAGAATATRAEPLALGFDLIVKPRASWFDRTAARSASFEDLAAGTPVHVAMRPLQRGKRENWIRGDLSWRTFMHASGLRAYDREQAALLGQIYRLYLADYQGYPGDGNLLNLDDFRDSLLWNLFEQASDKGVAFVGAGFIDGVEMGAAATAGLRADPDGEDLLLTPWAEIDGVELAHPLPIGTGGMAALTQAGQGRRKRADLLLAPAVEPLNPRLAALFAHGPVRVPAADREDFFTGLYPGLQSAVTVTSSSDLVELPVIADPVLQLRADYGANDVLMLAWSWHYSDPPRQVPVRRAGDHRRDLAFEDRVLSAVRADFPEAALSDREYLTGIATAEFTVHVLPRLQSRDDVEVTVEGERPSYRELEGTPVITVETTGTEHTDWFGLGIVVTLGGVNIPFGALFKALALGHDRLMLPDKTYFRLDHPNLQQLRQLIQEAEAQGEWKPENPGISRYQLSLWDDLVQLADESTEAHAWQSSVAALRSLDDIPAAEVPGTVRAELRDYQRDGLRWLAFLYRHRLGGILADDMGLGKTLQALALIAAARLEGRGDDELIVVDEEGVVSAPPFLVVAPASVVGVWRAEARRFVPDLDVRVLDTTARKRGTSVAQAAAGADLVVTSYTLLRTDEAEFAQVEWDGLILDEAQAVKNRNSKVYRAAKKIRAPFRLAITGTPMENSLADLWSLLSLTAAGLFPSAAKFKDDYIRPIEEGIDPLRITRLRKRLRPFMLRRTKDAVAADLPEKQELIETVPLAPRHRRLYDQILQRERKKVLGLLTDMDDDSNRMIVFRSLTLLRMLALDPTVIDGIDADGVPSSKLEALLIRLEEAIEEGHRVIVFSQFTSFLRHVRDELDDQRIEYAYLDGSVTMRRRAAVIDEFKVGSAPVFLISLKAGGAGLTLTEADYVFLMDPWWNPATEAQAIDRTHRIGQDKNVMVYRLVAEDTIEEKVLALQARKAKLFDDLMSGGEGFSSGFTADDLRELFGG